MCEIPHCQQDRGASSSHHVYLFTVATLPPQLRWWGEHRSIAQLVASDEVRGGTRDSRYRSSISVQLTGDISHLHVVTGNTTTVWKLFIVQKFIHYRKTEFCILFIFEFHTSNCLTGCTMLYFRNDLCILIKFALFVLGDQRWKDRYANKTPCPGHRRPWTLQYGFLTKSKIARCAETYFILIYQKMPIM